MRASFQSARVFVLGGSVALYKLGLGLGGEWHGVGGVGW